MFKGGRLSRTLETSSEMMIILKMNLLGSTCSWMNLKFKEQTSETIEIMEFLMLSDLLMQEWVSKRLKPMFYGTSQEGLKNAFKESKETSNKVMSPWKINNFKLRLSKQEWAEWHNCSSSPKIHGCISEVRLQTWRNNLK